MKYMVSLIGADGRLMEDARIFSRFQDAQTWNGSSMSSKEEQNS